MRAILALVLLADALDMIDSTVTNIAAPTIAAHLGGGGALIKWLGTSYMLAMGVLLVAGGRLGDKYGQRRLFLLGMAGFTVASAVAGLAQDPVMLILARVAQGSFGALLIPQGMAIMTRSFSREMMTRAFGLFGPLLGVASVGGPVLAGVIINVNVLGLSWRPIFLVNVVLGVIGLTLAIRILPRLEASPGTRLDGWGAGWLAAAMFSLLYGLIEGSSSGWGPVPVACLGAGAAFLAAFGRRQVTAAAPLIAPGLLRNRGFTSGMIAGLAIFAATTGLVYVLSLFLQLGQHASAQTASLTLVPLTIGIIASAFAAMGGLVARLGRTLIMLGLGIVLLGCGWVVALVVSYGVSLGHWALAPALFTIGIGMGCCYSTVFDVALGDIAPEEAGSASGSLSSVQQLAAGIGSAVVTTIFLHGIGNSPAHAMTLCLIVVGGLLALAAPLVTLMPAKAPAEPAR
jgi:EmrB/QacA subfamily drug resistance transporter